MGQCIAASLYNGDKPVDEIFGFFIHVISIDKQKLAGVPWLHFFEDDGNSLSNADTHGAERSAHSSPLHLNNGTACDPGA